MLHIDVFSLLVGLMQREELNELMLKLYERVRYIEDTTAGLVSIMYAGWYLHCLLYHRASKSTRR